MHTRYSKHQDQQYFIKLVRSGLKEQEAIDQMALMGIEASVHIDYSNGTSRNGVLWTIYDDYSEGKKHKNNLPFYHGKRRY